MLAGLAGKWARVPGLPHIYTCAGAQNGIRAALTGAQGPGAMARLEPVGEIISWCSIYVVKPWAAPDVHVKPCANAHLSDTQGN